MRPVIPPSWYQRSDGSYERTSEDVMADVARAEREEHATRDPIRKLRCARIAMRYWREAENPGTQVKPRLDRYDFLRVRAGHGEIREERSS